MPAKVSELINKLKREMPELADNPLLDEIEMAAYEGAPEEGGEEAPADDAEGEPDYDAMLPPEDDESGADGADEPPSPAPKKKFSPFKK